MRQYKISVQRTYIVFVEAETENEALSYAEEKAEELTNGVYDYSETETLDSWETTRERTAAFEKEVESCAMGILSKLLTPASAGRVWDMLGDSIVHEVYTCDRYQREGIVYADDVRKATISAICNELGLEDFA